MALGTGKEPGVLKRTTQVGEWEGREMGLGARHARRGGGVGLCPQSLSDTVTSAF